MLNESKNVGKKILCAILSLACCVTVLGTGAFAAKTAEETATPKLYSDSACVIDADNGEILYQKHANRQERPASITKQMTALLVLEKVEAGDISLDDKVKVTSDALSTVVLESTRIGFEPGEKRTVSDLMSCMLVDSANDAANILAEYVGGDVETFVGMMNDKAKELGCTNTQFDNPNGLDPDDGSTHLTTAHDMALISYELTKYKDYYDFAGQSSYTLDTDKVIKEPWTIATKVDMLDPNSEWYNEEVVAGKTGWTSKAHHTMCVYMNRGDRHLVIVVMNSPEWTEKYRDTEALMDYCCNSFDTITLTANEYQQAAETSMTEAGVEQSLDVKNLPELKLYLPAGMTANDLRYKVTSIGDDTVDLAVGISSAKWDEYHAATHVNGEKAILATYALPLKKSLADTVADTVTGANAQNGSGSGSAAGMTAPDTKILLTVAAALLVLMSLFFLIFRSVRNKKQKAMKAKAHKPIEIVIAPTEKYKDKQEKGGSEDR